jgi:hypothetical protein
MKTMFDMITPSLIENIPSFVAGQPSRLAVAPSVEINGRAGCHARNDLGKIARAHRRRSVDRGQHVALSNMRRSRVMIVRKARGRTLSAARRQSDGCVRDLKAPVLSQYPYRRETGPRSIPKLPSGGKVMEPSVLVRLATARPCSLASRTILFISKQVSHSM